MDYMDLLKKLFDIDPDELDRLYKEDKRQETFEESIAEVAKEVKKIYDAFVKAGFDGMDAFELTKALYIFILNKG